MKILFLAHYKNADGMGILAQNIILALHKCDIDLVFRHIDNGKPIGPTHQLLLPIENESLTNCTHCIQFLDTDYIIGTKKFEKNIAIVHEINENSMYNLLLMDEIWVFDNDLKETIINNLQINNVVKIDPVLNSDKDKLRYIYSDKNIEVDFERFSIQSVGSKMKEMLGA